MPKGKNMNDTKILSEYESKKILKKTGILVCREILAQDLYETKKAINELGYPVVIKACMDGLAHKSEQGLVFLNVKSNEETEYVYNLIKNRLPNSKILVQEMINNQREVMVGFLRDNIMGPCVMFGLGGIFTEILRDTTFRLAPIDQFEAMKMVEDIRAKKILTNVRGLPQVDKDSLADLIVKLSQLGAQNTNIIEIDINPICFNKQGMPVAVDSTIIIRD